MKPNKRVRSYQAHHHLVGLFAIAGAFILILNAALILAPTKDVRATIADNVKGWAWSVTGGWLSMNDIDDGPGGATYGVNIEPDDTVVGFAWSSNAGWACFGASCSHPDCVGVPPSGALEAKLDGNELQGWAKFCNLDDEGWISLNCEDAPGGCAASDYRVAFDFSTGQADPDPNDHWAWNGLAGALGWGWIDFSGVEMNRDSEDAGIDPPLCTDGIDNDYDGKIDCADEGCNKVEPMCPSMETNCALIGQTDCCKNLFDDDFDGPIDCDDADCAAANNCIPEDEHVVPGNSCTDGLDNDEDDLTDCEDPDCVGKQGCEICDNYPTDDDGDGDIDCDDSDCDADPVCTPAWLESKYGNVYATLGVEGNPPPPGQTNATYCITTGGTITNFSSEFGCEEEAEEEILLPIGPEGYVSKLGRLDVNGILSGRYGEVENITNASQIDASLGGKVYLYDQSAALDLPARIFMNATGLGSDGSGLLVVKGTDLNITGDISYEAAGVSQYLKNLASFGILVLADYSGPTPVGGNVYIDSGVERVVGTIYAERSINTGSTGIRINDVQLKVYGAFVSREVNFERMWSSLTEAAEVITFDGRAVVNPPPGYQDVSKSLPALGDTF